MGLAFCCSASMMENILWHLSHPSIVHSFYDYCFRCAELCTTARDVDVNKIQSTLKYLIYEPELIMVQSEGASICTKAKQY